MSYRTIVGYIVCTSAGIPCVLNHHLHAQGVLFPTKAGKEPYMEVRSEHQLHPERSPLNRLDTAIRRSEGIADAYARSMHRYFPLVSILIHARPWKIYRVWSDGERTYRLPYPFTRKPKTKPTTKCT